METSHETNSDVRLPFSEDSLHLFEVLPQGLVQTCLQTGERRTASLDVQL